MSFGHYFFKDFVLRICNIFSRCLICALVTVQIRIYNIAIRARRAKSDHILFVAFGPKSILTY